MRGSYLRTAMTGCTAVAALVLAGCGQSDSATDEAANTANHSTTPSPTTDVPATDDPAGRPGSSNGATTAPSDTAEQGGEHNGRSAECGAGEITISLGDEQGTAGSRHVPVQFTNSGDEPCTISGFPGVSYVAGDDNHQVGASADRKDDDSPEVKLAPGDVAHAMLRLTPAGVLGDEQCDRADVTGLRVYPPGEKDSAVLSYAATGCANGDDVGSLLTIRPVQPGASGP